MALRAQYALGHSEFNAFLFAAVGEEKSGLPLTVLSALARLGLDPWGEAARLSDLPKDSAAGALAESIAALPEGDWTMTDAQAIALRLVECLPTRSAAVAELPVAGRLQGNKSRLAMWLVGIGLLAVVLFTIVNQTRSADQGTQPAPISVPRE